MPQTIELMLPALPHFSSIGSNARHGNKWAKIRAEQTEKDKWRLLLLEQGRSLRTVEQGPLLTGRVTAEATLVFPNRAHLPDESNVMHSLKLLIDLLQVNEVTQINSGSFRQTGWVGLIGNDRDVTWGSAPHIEIDAERGPMTILRITEA